MPTISHQMMRHESTCQSLYGLKKKKDQKVNIVSEIEREEAEMSLSGKRKRQVHPVPEELIEDLFDEKQRNGELN